MTELMRTNDIVLMSFLEALLRDAKIEVVVLDGHASVMDGSALAVPRRLMVAEGDVARARRLLADAGIDPDASP